MYKDCATRAALQMPRDTDMPSSHTARIVGLREQGDNPCRCGSRACPLLMRQPTMPVWRWAADSEQSSSAANGVASAHQQPLADALSDIDGKLHQISLRRAPLVVGARSA